MEYEKSINRASMPSIAIMWLVLRSAKIQKQQQVLRGGVHPITKI